MSIFTGQPEAAHRLALLTRADALDAHQADPDAVAGVLAHLDALAATARIRLLITDPEAAGAGLAGTARALWGAAFIG